MAAAGGISRLRELVSQQGQCIELIAAQQPLAAAANADVACLQQQLEALEQQLVGLCLIHDEALAKVARHGQAGDLHYNALRRAAQQMAEEAVRGAKRHKAWP